MRRHGKVDLEMRIGWWDAHAADLQARCGDSRLIGEEITPQEANALLLHTREDVVLVVSHLSSLNRQVWHVKMLLAALVLLALLRMVF